MRDAATDNMGKNLSADFQLSGLTINEFFGTFEVLGNIREYAFLNFANVEVVETSINVVDEGTIYTLYHHNNRPMEIFVKI